MWWSLGLKFLGLSYISVITVFQTWHHQNVVKNVINLIIFSAKSVPELQWFGSYKDHPNAWVLYIWKNRAWVQMKNKIARYSFFFEKLHKNIWNENIKNDDFGKKRKHWFWNFLYKCVNSKTWSKKNFLINFCIRFCIFKKDFNKDFENFKSFKNLKNLIHKNEIFATFISV